MFFYLEVIQFVYQRVTDKMVCMQLIISGNNNNNNSKIISKSYTTAGVTNWVSSDVIKHASAVDVGCN